MLSGKLAILIFAAIISLHYNTYKNRVRLAHFKISYIN